MGWYGTPRIGTPTWWRRMEPDDVCREALAARPGCRICGAKEYLTLTGISQVHDRNLHGADRVAAVRPTYRQAAPARRPSDPLDD